MARLTLRSAVLTLSLSAAALAGWISHEGTGPVTLNADGAELMHPYVPVAGDVPTIGHGSTRYEDGRRVTLADPPITRQRAESLARALHSEHERGCKAALPGVALSQAEYDLYCGDFTGQYGVTAFRDSSIRRNLLAGKYRAACDALLQYRSMTSPRNLGQGWVPYTDKSGRQRWKYDCSQTVNGKRNRVCWGVWDRQQQRHAACIAEQDRIDWLAGTQLDHCEVE